MRLFPRLSVTFRLIRQSLFPAQTAISADSLDAVTPGRENVRAILPESFPALVHDPGQYATGGRISFFIPGVLSLAAPCVLFRLKRLGLSGCVVTVTHGGLLVEARR